MNTRPQAKMFVRSLSGSSSKILIAFLLARSALDVQELRDWTGCKRETIYDGLRILEDCGMVGRQTLAHGRIVWLPARDAFPGFFQVSEKGTPEQLEAGDGAQMSEKGTPEGSRCPESGHLTLGGGESINLKEIENTSTPQTQMSEKGTPESGKGLPSTIQILEKTSLLFDGNLVYPGGLENRDPLDALAWCAYAYSRKARLSGPGGLVRKRLMDNERPPEWARSRWWETLPPEFLEALDLIEYPCHFCSQVFRRSSEIDAHVANEHHVCIECGENFPSAELEKAHYTAQHDPEPSPLPASVSPADPSILQPVNGGLTPEQAWLAVLDQLKSEMPRASFDTWVCDTRARQYDGDALEIGARNAYARDWLDNRLRSTVERLLVGILNQETRVRFVVLEEVPA